MKKIILFLFPLFIYAQPDCMMTLYTLESTTAGVTTTTITTYTWDGLTSSFTTNDNSSSGYITYNTNGDVVEQFTDYGAGTTIQVNNQYNSDNQLIQSISNNSGIESITTYTWDGLTYDSFTTNGSTSGSGALNTNGDLIETVYEFGTGITMTVNYQYDSDNRLIQFSVTYTGDFSANNYVVDYVWDGLTANYSYSGALQNTGYIIYNSTGYMLEVYGNNGGSESTQLYEYNCNTSTLLDINKSKTLLSTINLLGQETVQKGFNIEIYNDGSIEKKYLIK